MFHFICCSHSRDDDTFNVHSVSSVQCSVPYELVGHRYSRVACMHDAVPNNSSDAAQMLPRAVPRHELASNQANYTCRCQSDEAAICYYRSTGVGEGPDKDELKNPVSRV